MAKRHRGRRSSPELTACRQGQHSLKEDVIRQPDGQTVYRISCLTCDLLHEFPFRTHFQANAADLDVQLFRQELALRREKGYTFESKPTHPASRCFDRRADTGRFCNPMQLQDD